MSRDMNHFEFSESGDLINIPSKTSSKEDFDFYAGNWKIRNRRLKTRLNNCTEWIDFDATQTMRIVLNGLGNIDHLCHF